jgi:hypothetical protein
LQRKWLKNASNIKDDAYEIPEFAYGRKMDQLVLANSITTSKVEEKKSPPCPKNVMTNSEGDDGFGGHHVGRYTKLCNWFQ